ncbi:response regulator [Mongoliibacter ruber]|uniref:Response regulator receiver domain-containing protein n=1 Tax=Mongoliibacter ruber TaxID=1750599 RepID=A0A2T0WD37_9BACT|nr:response regulator [Mongoliibacter ruber]PRY84623.1 response regulator receiver domain-containing protein [Mongoliibacter ruber]
MNDKTLNILLADDDESDRLLFKEAFDELRAQTRVNTVNDGMELLKLLSQTDEENLPHILFLDINMPKKNGLECLLEIRADKKYKDVSIAIYSTSSSEKDMQETFLNGANVYIHKPNSFQKLKKLLEKAIMYTHVYQEPPFNKDNFLLVAE